MANNRRRMPTESVRQEAAGLIGNGLVFNGKFYPCFVNGVPMQTAVPYGQQQKSLAGVEQNFSGQAPTSQRQHMQRSQQMPRQQQTQRPQQMQRAQQMQRQQQKQQKAGQTPQFQAQGMPSNLQYRQQQLQQHFLQLQRLQIQQQLQQQRQLQQEHMYYINQNPFEQLNNNINSNIDVWPGHSMVTSTGHITFDSNSGSHLMF